MSAIILLLIFVVLLYAVFSTIKPKHFPKGESGAALLEALKDLINLMLRGAVNETVNDVLYGPRWYPFIGSGIILHKLTKHYGSQWRACFELSKHYGTNVLGLKSGSELLVVVYGEENVRQVFNDKNFDSRPINYFCESRCLGKSNIGITCGNGKTWTTHRQFAMKQLKNVGYGRLVMEEEIQNQQSEIIKEIENNPKKAVYSKELFSISITNVLWKLVAGEHIEVNKLKKLLDTFSKRAALFNLAGNFLPSLPLARFVLPNASGYNLMNKFNMEVTEILNEAIEKHKDNKIPGTDLISLYLEEIRKNRNELFTEDQLKIVCLDLLIAASQTSADSLSFAFLRMIKNQNIQDKMHEEIKSVLGNDTPCYKDKQRLVYTSAFILETQRYYTIAPIASPRMAEQDTIVDGYLIPKGSTVLLSLADIHHDPKLWDEPHEFKPERFIDEEGNLRNSEHLYIFGKGQRRCPGDALAKSFIFTTLVGILQKYRVDSYDGTEVDDTPITGSLSSPAPYAVKFTLRRLQPLEEAI